VESDAEAEQMSVRGRDRSDTERLKKEKKYRTSAVSVSRTGFGTAEGGRIVRGGR